MAQLDQLAQHLMALVRDRAINACDGLVVGAVGGAQADAWAAQLSEHTVRDVVAQLIPDIVDQTLFELLNAIDQDELPLLWRDESGAVVSLSDAGESELAGWLLMSGEGWRERFSSTRLNDYNAALRLVIDWEVPGDPDGS